MLTNMLLLIWVFGGACIYLKLALPATSQASFGSMSVPAIVMFRSCC